MEHELSVTRIINVCCDKCGSEDLAIPNAERRDDPILCNACGADNGTLATLEE